MIRAGRQKGFVVNRHKKPTLSTNKPDLTSGETKEALTAVVHGLKASSLEERLANALDMYGVPFEFRRTTIHRGLPGFKELDFLIHSRYGDMGVSVQDDTFIHLGQEAHDKLQESIIVDMLRKEGVEFIPMQFPDPGSIIGTFSQEVLGTQAAANQIVKERIL